MLQVSKLGAVAGSQNATCCCLKTASFACQVVCGNILEGVVSSQKTQAVQFSSGINLSGALTPKVGQQMFSPSLAIRVNQDLQDLNSLSSSCSNLIIKRSFASPGKHYTERRLIGYSPQQLFNVVSSIENYNKFVPWCSKSVITKQLDKNEYMEAELEVGFQLFIERYTSKVQMQAPQRIQTSVADSSLFHKLDSNWEFQPGPTPNTCWVQFSVEFTFRTVLYQNVATVFMEEVVQRMVASFENRCAQLYGPPSISSKLKLNGQVKK